jgi:hypothetical protein
MGNLPAAAVVRSSRRWTRGSPARAARRSQAESCRPWPIAVSATFRHCQREWPPEITKVEVQEVRKIRVSAYPPGGAEGRSGPGC